ncbi:hypothetical protein CIHG_04647 [Coccidioides immitis H538.4]|uniref:G-patch domain-containing protein n=1 Tax=Coccidioides immitis H538.4 TaxID=396776 RepID=A0A0J8UIC8_COCIT|nr:hypothetical protein CIHG_04647 [Coccidioides immitis H538.4]
MAAPPAAPKGGLSLYANLLDPSDTPSASSTISRAPVVFKQATDGESQQDDAASKKQQISAVPASLRFQPTKRPQLPSQKLKAKPGIPKPPVLPTSASLVSQGTTPAPATGAAGPQAKSTLADWTATADDDDVNGFYGEKRQRGGRKKRKKNRDAEVVYNWDDIYDPSRPNNYDQYKHSDEKIREVREWKDRLYAHRMARRMSSDMESDDDYRRRPMNKQFAPPTQFAPPPNLNDIPREPSAPNSPVTEVVPPPTAPLLDDQTGEDAFARRLRMSQSIAQTSDIAAEYSIPPPPPEEIPPEPTPATSRDAYSSATISRAPVRYTLPPPPEDIPATEEELEAAFAKEAEEEPEGGEGAPRSLRPGQKGFAERLLSKYGWTKGSGLGASGTGIVNPLQVKVQKQKKRPDAEGGGFATPAGRGKIIGGHQKKQEEGKFGAMSEVVVLHGMLDGMDLDAELEAGDDGGLMQEIGDECGEKYGRVERVFIDRSAKGQVPVFVKFTNQLSALRAVNALEGRIFNGNTITARFFDTEKFEKGIYK